MFLAILNNSLLIKINDTAEVQIAKPDPSAKLESNQDVKSKEP